MNEILHFTSENIFLIGSILVFTAILVSKTGNKYGVPSLLIFLLVGMLFGSDGLGLVFDNYNIAQFLSIIALCVILFTGGLETKLKDIRPVMGPGLVLSTVGVLLTVVFTGAFIYFLSRIEQIGLSLSIVIPAGGRDVINRFRVGVQHPEELQHAPQTEPEADAGAGVR